MLTGKKTPVFPNKYNKLKMNKKNTACTIILLLYMFILIHILTAISEKPEFIR